MRAAALGGCLALSCSSLLSFTGARDVQTVEYPSDPPRKVPGQHLAVIVPVYGGDLSRAVSSLGRWPPACSPLTERNADLVLYYAEGEEDAPAVTDAVETIRETAGHCFAETRLVYAHLSEEEDVYPKGPSVMFFKMFLDEGVHADLSAYDALAIVEWDVLVASDRSFEELHHAAFRGNEGFWVKGSNLGGTNFHSTAQAAGMWNVLGHINGNAIYNNNDPAFVEYVDYTRTRWEYNYPYDVALWLTISDFPYSWPLWQRYSGKFVTTNLISYVGYEHVDHSTVSDAVAGQTLFIHGSRVDEGNLASLEATKDERKQTLLSGRGLSDDTETPPPVCNAACGGGDAPGLPVGTSTACDDTCAGESARYGGFLCGAGNSDRFGPMCRLCFVDVEEARRQERSLALTKSDLGGGRGALHVVMCDTMRPPEAAECSDKCGRKKDTVCDESCGTGRHGDYNCNWRNYGPKCRFCFNDLEAALMADTVAQRRGVRVIMCSTFEPPHAEEPRKIVVNTESWAEENAKSEEAQVVSRARTSRSRRLQQWRDNEEWKGVPILQTNDEFTNNVNSCDEENCPHTNSNGFRGRVCDPSCADGVPFGTNGCGAREGRFGDLCRVCYIDQDRALANDDPDNRAIMCGTIFPVTPYESMFSRRLSAAVEDSPLLKLSSFVAEVDDAQSMFADATTLPYVNDLVRGNLCAFIAGGANEVEQVGVAVMSVFQFLPGMTVAVAVDSAGFHAYQRAIGVLPGVTVHATEDHFTASLFADQYCSVDTSLILYMKSGSVFSRQFTSKDTHSPHGDLLVVYGSAKANYVDRELAKQTTAALGFQSPSFTLNTDLFLPVGANADLRDVLTSGDDPQERRRHRGAREIMEGFMIIRDVSSVPQLMAALAYSRNTPGVWFIDPETWVSQHLFRTASIWEIPLVKPRFTCSVDPLALKPDAQNMDVALILQSNLDFFTRGGTCDSGYVDIRRGH